ncbi:aminoglycoside phosphotransferase family protein [Streptomyces uncialis]|uniref:aminoglycoside phosphotransferase family protein n=1 Tax=Streptomyces uncialis TaxID=1048205 RepID=UPI00379B9DF7
MTRPAPAALDWVASVVGAPVTGADALREGSGPWRLRLAGGGSARAVVLRTGGPGGEVRERFATEVAALEAAAERGVAAPRVIAYDLDGTAAGRPALLTSVVPGSSRVPAAADPARMRALGAAAAALHSLPMTPRAALPRRSRPLADVDFGALRRPHGPSPLWRRATEAFARAAVPDEAGVLVHGDLWQGNTMWDGGTLTGIVDWDSAGVGHPGVDLGSLRCDAALYFGERAADEVLSGWCEASGRAAGDTAYWDLVAALSTPPDLAMWLPALTEQGGPALDRATVAERRDRFLRAALHRLDA